MRPYAGMIVADSCYTIAYIRQLPGSYANMAPLPLLIYVEYWREDLDLK